MKRYIIIVIVLLFTGHIIAEALNNTSELTEPTAKERIQIASGMYSVCDYGYAAFVAYPPPFSPPNTLQLDESDTYVNIGLWMCRWGTMNWTITESLPWLSFTSYSGTVVDSNSYQNVGLTLDWNYLYKYYPPGQVSGVVTFNFSMATPYYLTVIVDVPVLEPVLVVTVDSLDWGTSSGWQTFYIDNSGNATLSWSITENCPWITNVTPVSGTVGTGSDINQIDVQASMVGLSSGIHLDSLIISSNGGSDVIYTVIEVVPPPGASCSTPLVYNINSGMLPYSITNKTTCGLGNNYTTTCLGSYDGGEDLIIKLNVSSAMYVDITLDPKGTSYTGIAISDACPDNGGNCIDYSIYTGNTPHTMGGVNLVAGTYYIIVDGVPSPGCIEDFDIEFVQANLPPVVSDIPNQTITVGESFAPISLDEFVSDPTNTDSELSWTYSGNSDLIVNINPSTRIATISPPNGSLIGSETITFRATDPGLLWDADSAIFTVEPKPCYDLRISNFELTGSSEVALEEGIGDRITLLVTNDGNIASVATGLQFVISPDINITNSDRHLNDGIAVLQPLQPLENIHFTNMISTMSIPDDFSEGPAFLGIIISGAESECDTLNNTAFIPITVVAKNEVPYFTSQFANATVMEGDEFILTIAAGDTDGDDITFECLQCPENAYLTGQVNQTEFVFTPDYIDVDQNYLIQIGASDGIDLIDTSFNLNVVNRPLRVIIDSVNQSPPPPGSCREHLVTDTLKIWFNEPVNSNSLLNHVSMVSTLGEPEPIYLYQEGNDFFRVIPSDGVFTPFDRIGLIIDSEVLDLSGYQMGKDDTVWAYFGPVVYPGDADNNGIVDERDILLLGIFWGSTGCKRHENPDLTWSMNAAQSWVVLRATYADMNGDGNINADDICGVSENWGKTPYNTKGRNEIEIVPTLTAKVLNESFGKQIYLALADCPESRAKESLLDAFESFTDDESSSLPQSFTLAQNYPNPFNPSTTIEYSVMQDCHVEILVFDLLGKRVATLIDEPMARGTYTTVWNGLDEIGNSVSSGIYFYKITAGDFTDSKKMILLK